MDTLNQDTMETPMEVCPGCGRHCSLGAPGCPRGEAYASGKMTGTESEGSGEHAHDRGEHEHGEYSRGEHEHGGRAHGHGRHHKHGGHGHGEHVHSDLNER